MFIVSPPRSGRRETNDEERRSVKSSAESVEMILHKLDRCGLSLWVGKAKRSWKWLKLGKTQHGLFSCCGFQVKDFTQEQEHFSIWNMKMEGSNLIFISSWPCGRAPCLEDSVGLKHSLNNAAKKRIPATCLKAMLFSCCLLLHFKVYFYILK